MDIAKSLKTALSTITGQLSALKDELADTNRQLGIIGIKVQELQNMPISLEDWGEYLKLSIKSKGDKYLTALHNDLLANYRGQEPSNERPWKDYESGVKSGAWLLPSDPFWHGEMTEAMCFYFPDVVYERLMARLTEKLEARWGNEDHPPVAERRKIIAELTQQQDALKQRRSELEAQIDEIEGALSS